MKRIKHLSQKLSAIVIIFTLAITGISPKAVSAQNGDGIRRQVNAGSGRVSFIGPESGRELPASRALGTFIRPQNPAMALANRYAPEFGLKNPSRDLSEMKSARGDDGRITVRFQQNYQGIPVMGGELIVNTNDNGDLYSMNGEVSPDLSLPTQPTIDSAQAAETALEAISKWYAGETVNYVASEPELWVFDESLLRPSTRPAELVWRMEVTSADESMPLRELVLVNAQRGSISLHFNQIDTAWTGTSNSTIQLTGELVPHLAAASWYVATTGDDTNSCTSTGSACATINGAIGKTTAGDIVYVAAGTYTDSGTEVVLIDKDITLSGGWNSTFTTQNGTSIIDGQGARRGIFTTAGTDVVIDNFTIQKGHHIDQGGGVFNSGVMTIDNSKIINNDAFADHTVSSFNSYEGGGGIYNYFGTLTINNTTISENITGELLGKSTGGDSGGGGIFNYWGTLTLNNSLITANSSLGPHQGNGILSHHGLLTLNNSTVSGNQIGYGAVSTEYETVFLNNATIVDNKAYGIYVAHSTLNLSNTIVARNGIEGDCFSNYGTITSQGYNLIGKKPADCAFTSTTGDLVGTDENPIYPYLTLLRDNGGPTFTHALIMGNSPALDAGNPATPGSGGSACLGSDQRGVARPVGSRCDIGAYEGSVPWEPSPLVSTYTAKRGTTLPGTFLCDQTTLYCTNNLNPHADGAHKYAIGTFNLYATNHNRDSINNAGMTIVSTVHYSSGYANAFWSGAQMVYGDAYGFPLADDVVAHELTHGVTQYESNLFPYYQSGAIDESFSDLWGEYYDQTNGLGNDTVGVKWLIGEDVSGLGAIRSMSSPPTYGDPDKMSSANYYEGDEDGGGIHSNSGVNNKAVFLMVDGGSFNGKAVTALGWEKTAAIYYEVNTNLLSSGADYSDLYYALQQACTDLIGQHGITSADCAKVKDAVDAVQMNGQPAANFNTDAPLCTAAGTVPNIAFFDSMEAGAGNWQFGASVGSTRWQYDSPYGPFATSGEHMLYADDYPEARTDTYVRTKSSIHIPDNAFLHFDHAFGFEDFSGNNYDGGILEYSINNGASWLDAGPLFVNNGYNGMIYNVQDPNNNPLAGKSGFVNDSHGYISSRLNLQSLANQNVLFRWRMGLDAFGLDWGWWLDNIQVYTCETATALPPLTFQDQVYRTYNPPETVTVTNNNGSDITLGTLQGSSSVGTTWIYNKSFFIETNTCSGATLAPSANCTFDVKFLPWQQGFKTGTITIPSDAPDGPYLLSLFGNSIAGSQLLLNRSFESFDPITKMPKLWSATPTFKTGLDGINSSWAAHGTYSVKLVGDGDLKVLSQQVDKPGNAGDDFSFFVVTHGNNIPADSSRWLLQIMFYNGSTIVENRNVNLQTGTYAYKLINRTYTAANDYTHIIFRIHFGKSSGTAWIDIPNLQWAP